MEAADRGSATLQWAVTAVVMTEGIVERTEIEEMIEIIGTAGIVEK